MNYNQINSLLPNDEVNYINDSEVFFKENNIDASLFKSNDFILFEYTIENWRNTLDILDENEIEYSIHTDKEDLDYIVVTTRIRLYLDNSNDNKL